jgi:hypothetical protein
MPRKRNNPVLLTAEDRDTLEDLIASGHAPARQLTHARILLKADDAADKPAWPDTKIADALEVSPARRFSVCERGSPGRAWRLLWSIASRKTPSPRSSMESRRPI